MTTNEPTLIPLYFEDSAIEAMVITAEECAEVIQEVTKAQRFGREHRVPGKDLDARQALSIEAGQLYAMLGILLEGKVVDEEFFMRGVQEKREKLKVWSHLPREWL